MAGMVTLKSQCVKLRPCAFKGQDLNTSMPDIYV